MGTSRRRDSDPAALDYGLSQHAPRRLHSRRGDIEGIIRRLAALAHSGLQALDTARVRAVARLACHRAGTTL
ncbi:hypothetical protein [Streptomyces hygroscopicus]|uniref:hypothetical protein n=1 Tax=Streptomyces hygroscopicus TaxID=1912 RepID=UPI00367C7EA6